MSTTPVSRSPAARFRDHSDTVLDTAHTLVQLAKDVTEIANVPFASQAASLVLSLLEIAKVSKVEVCLSLRAINYPTGCQGQ